MTRTYTQLREGQVLDVDSSLVKTYMVEAHANGTQDHDDVVTLLKSTTGDETTALPNTAVLETDEDFFVVLSSRAKQGSADLFVDATDPRFWLIHSMNASDAVDWCIERLVVGTPALDTAWLPIELLEWTSRKGSFRGLGLDFDRRFFVREEEEQMAGVTFLKMQLWGNQAGNVLDLLRKSGAFPHETTLSKVKVKYALQDQRDNFTLDDIKFNGKITARGTSFQSHLTLVTEIYRRYAAAIRSLEARTRIGYVTQDRGWSVQGSPVFFHFQQPLPSTRDFCVRLLNCSPPFRLWGVPVQVGPEYFQVSAVDLHVGQPLDLEVGPDFMRVYLHSASCGNTIVRLLTNLQHTVDARVEAEIDGNRIPELQPTDA